MTSVTLMALVVAGGAMLVRVMPRARDSQRHRLQI